jgi:hypothetical protein
VTLAVWWAWTSQAERGWVRPGCATTSWVASISLSLSVAPQNSKSNGNSLPAFRDQGDRWTLLVTSMQTHHGFNCSS